MPSWIQHPPPPTSGINFGTVNLYMGQANHMHLARVRKHCISNSSSSPDVLKCMFNLQPAKILTANTRLQFKKIKEFLNLFRQFIHYSLILLIAQYTSIPFPDTLPISPALLNLIVAKNIVSKITNHFINNHPVIGLVLAVKIVKAIKPYIPTFQNLPGSATAIEKYQIIRTWMSNNNAHIKSIVYTNNVEKAKVLKVLRKVIQKVVYLLYWNVI